MSEYLPDDMNLEDWIFRRVADQVAKDVARAFGIPEFVVGKTEGEDIEEYFKNVLKADDFDEEAVDTLETIFDEPPKYLTCTIDELIKLSLEP